MEEPLQNQSSSSSSLDPTFLSELNTLRNSLEPIAPEELERRRLGTLRLTLKRAAFVTALVQRAGREESKVLGDIVRQSNQQLDSLEGILYSRASDAAKDFFTGKPKRVTTLAISAFVYWQYTCRRASSP